jgi:hypothetical protein
VLTLELHQRDFIMSLTAKLQKVNTTPINDWAVRKQSWLTSVSKLYETVEQWLSELVNEGYIQITKENQTLSEAQIGEYQITKLGIELGSHAVILEPVGTRVHRAYGRIDFFLRGKKLTGYMLILTKNAHDNDEWRVVNKNARSDIRPLFTQQLFEETLEKWVNQIL